jgi:hypothetical protein
MFLVDGNKTRPLLDVREEIVQNVVGSFLKSYWRCPIKQNLVIWVVDKFTDRRYVSPLVFHA